MPHFSAMFALPSIYCTGQIAPSRIANRLLGGENHSRATYSNDPLGLGGALSSVGRLLSVAA